MKQLLPLAGGLVALVLAAPAPLAAQQSQDPARDTSVRIEQALEESGIVPALETLAAAATPELERTIADLAASLAGLADRIGRDPELRASANRAARGMVDVAAVVVTEQAGILQQVLREAADRLEAASRQRDH
jgi:hypothetical protein